MLRNNTGAETQSWYDTLTNTIGWLNPFSSSAPSVKRAAIQSLVVLQLIDSAAGKAVCFAVDQKGTHHELSCLDPNLQSLVLNQLAQSCQAYVLSPTPAICVETHEVKLSHRIFTRMTEAFANCTIAFYDGMSNACVLQTMQDFFAATTSVPTPEPIIFPNITNSTLPTPIPTLIPTSTPSSSDEPSNQLNTVLIAGGMLLTTIAVGSLLLFSHCKHKKKPSASLTPTEKTPLIHTPKDIASPTNFYEDLLARLERLDDNDTDVIKLKNELQKFFDAYSSAINLEIMNHPVTLPCQHSDEKGKLEDLFKQPHDENGCNCPICRQPFQQTDIVENTMIREAIVRKLRDFEARVVEIENALKEEVRINMPNM